MNKRVTITFDLEDETMTWAQLRQVIEANTPAMWSYPVVNGLSGTIFRHTGWGPIRVTVD